MKRKDTFKPFYEFHTVRTALGKVVTNSVQKELRPTPEEPTKSERNERLSNALHTVLAIADLAMIPLLDISEAHKQQVEQRNAELETLPQRMTIQEIAVRTERGEGTIVHPGWVR